MRLTVGTHPLCTDDPACTQVADPLYATLSNGRYVWPISNLRLVDFDGYLTAHRTARKRAARSSRLGYRFSEIDRCDHADDIYRINTSAPERQGRPMTDGYTKRQTFDPLPAYPCPRHAIRTYGVTAPSGPLVAYLVLHIAGDIALVSQILGHAAHLAADVMYLLCVEAFRATLDRSGPINVIYNRHDSGTPGLRYFKDRLGFTPERVEWAL